MNSQKFILTVVAGTVVYFLLGWLVYGVILNDMMKSATIESTMRGDADMVWWALVLGNLSFVVLLTYLVGKTHISSAAGGASLGFSVGLLVALSMDLTMYATTTLMTKPVFMIVDALASALMASIAGGVVAWVYNYNRKPVAVA